MRDFSQKLKRVPELPGSYQMKNQDGNIIYVGKAKNLKRRLKSYFTRSVTGKTAMLVEEIADFEYIVTNTELESLLLEITLIKKYNPKYNILLKDDKSYPYIELTDEKYPRLRVIRNVNRKRRKAHLFGPYPNVSAARKTVHMLNRIYPLRKCDPLKKDYCLYYHIHECLGYCKKEIEEEVLSKMKEEIISFFKGDSEKVITTLKEEMQKASEALHFEKAKELKEMIEDIEITLRKQKIDLNRKESFDLIAYSQKENYLAIVLFFVRDGLLFGRHQELIRTMDDIEEDLFQFLIQFYEKNSLIPKEILVPEGIDTSLLENYLKVRVRVPQKGVLKQLFTMAEENAKMVLKEEASKVEQDEVRKEKALKELATLLHLSTVSRMESFDNSHLFGTYYVGGMVVYQDFQPLRSEYRKYKIDRSCKDDLEAMREVLYRRYYKVLMENLRKPDLIILDGGIAQMKVCEEVLTSFHLKIPFIGLKKDEKHRTSAIINQNYEEIELSNKSDLFLYLAKIQEEVHRYAITYHRTIKQKGNLASLLELAPGIGEVRRKELLKQFGSLKRIKQASLEELQTVLGKELGKNFKQYLNELEEGD